MENFDYDYMLNGFEIIAEAIDRANALKAIEMRYNWALDKDAQNFLDKVICLGVYQYNEKNAETALAADKEADNE